MLFALLTSASMDVDALKAALKVGDITKVREWLNIDQADPRTGIVRVLRALCGGDSWHQRLSTHLEDILAWPTDETEGFVRGVEIVANTGEHTADAFVQLTKGLVARLGARRAKETYEFNTRQRAERNRVKRMPEHPALPRVFCWGPLEDALEDVDAELAGIDQALWRGHKIIEQARRDAADAVDAGFVRFLVAACRTQLAVTSALWARAEARSYCDSYDTGALVLERPSRDADGVPLLSRSEIDRVVPAVFGVDVVWAALPTDGPRRERQARAILVAEALYEARRKQLAAHAAASGREDV